MIGNHIYYNEEISFGLIFILKQFSTDSLTTRLVLVKLRFGKKIAMRRDCANVIAPTEGGRGCQDSVKAVPALLHFLVSGRHNRHATDRQTDNRRQNRRQKTEQVTKHRTDDKTDNKR